MILKKKFINHSISIRINHLINIITNHLMNIIIIIVNEKIIIIVMIINYHLELMKVNLF